MAKSQRLLWPVILLSALTFACSLTAPLPKNSITAKPTADLQQYEISEITYELDVNWGIKETDKIILRKDGTADYLANLGAALRRHRGTSDPEQKGTFDGRLDPKEFEQLAALVIRRNFFVRKDRYSSGVADASTITTSVLHSGGRKTVVNYGGGGDDEVGEIERAIISVARNVHWQKK